MLAWISPLLDRVKQDLTNSARAAIITTAADMNLLYSCYNARRSSCPDFDGQSASHYQRLAEVSTQLRSLVDATPLESPDPQEVAFAWLAIDSLAGKLRSERELVVYDHGAVRDPLMAQNITRLAELAYPHEKLIVWAHNAHISKQFPDESGHLPMGSYLSQRWGDQLATIGLFMFRGVSANNVRTPVIVKPPLPGSLEAYAYSLRLGALYLRVPQVDAPGSGDDWLHRPILFYVWGDDNEVDTMAGSYDGLIIIDRSTMPHYN